MSGEWKRTSDLQTGDKVTKAIPSDQLWSGFVLVDERPAAPTGAPLADDADLFGEGVK